jgi:hypothetical protein
MGCWPEPEIAANVNTDELGDLGLTSAEEDALVAFMMTLSDTYRVQARPQPRMDSRDRFKRSLRTGQSAGEAIFDPGE